MSYHVSCQCVSCKPSTFFVCLYMLESLGIIFFFCYGDGNSKYYLKTWYSCLFSGVGSGRVVIWNMAPVISIEAANDEKVPKILCQLDNHLGNFIY